jgi:glycerol-3-phosphate dehydrogenase
MGRVRLGQDRERAAADDYDLIVIGGGIYGASLTLEAARRGLGALLLEKDDLGGATSWHSFRILHGGLRYLPKLELARFHEAVRGRRWFCRHFPDLVTPLPCLMPLHGTGPKRPAVMRPALHVNDWLGRRRNAGVPSEAQLPRSWVVEASEVLRQAPAVRSDGLQGGALWHDAALRSPQRVLMEMLRWAVNCGARVFPRVEVETVSRNGGRVSGVSGYDHVVNQRQFYSAPTVFDATGPWAGTLGRNGETSGKLVPPTLAFNVLFDAPAPMAGALAFESADGQTLVAQTYGGKLFLGTGHAPWHGPPGGDVGPGEDTLQSFIDGAHRAIPELGIGREKVLRVTAGLLPAAREGDTILRRGGRVVDHGKDDGVKGLFSLVGVKYTTAPCLATRALRRCFGRLPGYTDRGRPDSGSVISRTHPKAAERAADSDLQQVVDRLIDEEAARSVDDLLLRRTDWGFDPISEARLRARLAPMMSGAVSVDASTRG